MQRASALLAGTMALMFLFTIAPSSLKDIKAFRKVMTLSLKSCRDRKAPRLRPSPSQNSLTLPDSTFSWLNFETRSLFAGSLFLKKHSALSLQHSAHETALDLIESFWQMPSCILREKQNSFASFA